MKVEALRDPAPAHESTSCVIPYSVGNPGTYQQRLSQVVALFTVEPSSDKLFYS